MGEGILAARARGPWLYCLEGRRVLDFSLDRGRQPFGHAPLFLREPFRRALARGERCGLDTPELSGLLSRFSRYLPGYHVIPVESAGSVRQRLPGALATLVPESLAVRSDRGAIAAAVASATGPLLFDESASAFCQQPDLYALEYRPAAVLFDGALGCPFLAWSGTLPLEVPAFRPDAVTAARAGAVFSRVRKRPETFGQMAALIGHFLARCTLTPVSWQGNFPVFAFDAALRAAALAAGFLLAEDGVVRVSAAHQAGMVERLASFLNSHGGA